MQIILRAPDRVPTTEYSIPYIQGMVDRMGMSFCKYGPVAEAYPDNVDALKSLLLRIARYVGTRRLSAALSDIVEEKGELRGDGNTEWLMDAGNFAMIEFMCPSHPKAHFKPTDSHESPGRVWRADQDGVIEISHRANDLTPQPVPTRVVPISGPPDAA